MSVPLRQRTYTGDRVGGSGTAIVRFAGVRSAPLLEDRALIEGTLAGRQQDFEVLVERYQKMVYAFVYRYLRDADGADDVVQSTFISC